MSTETTGTVNADATEILGGTGEVMIEVEGMDSPAVVARHILLLENG